MAYTVDRDGFEILPGVLDQPVVTALCEAVARPESSESVRARSGVYAIRNLLAEAPAVRELARSERLLDFVRPTLGQHARAVKATLFDKRPGANWLVPWHQDLTITVQSRRDVPGFGPWTLKAGVVNVQPPASVLEQVLALRIHLDDCDCDNGALRVLPGSHREGRLTAARIEAWRRGCTEVPCPVPRGGALLMRPLLLHASSPASSPGHRRVIHIEYAAADLPGGLEWLA